jgi:hypothetical protein
MPIQPVIRFDPIRGAHAPRVPIAARRRDAFGRATSGRNFIHRFHRFTQIFLCLNLRNGLGNLRIISSVIRISIHLAGR